MFDILDNPLVFSQLEKDNFLVEDTNNDSNLCCIYFSSHGVFYPVTETIFQNEIVKKDRYEWYKRRLPNIKRHIFLRDIRLSFYVEGINRHYNSIDKVIELLRGLTDGYDVITIGSSAGGYMAALVGGVLSAKVSFVFSAQFDLLKDSAFGTKKLLLRHNEDQTYSKWFNICGLRKSNMVYICPMNSYSDIIQYERLINNTLTLRQIQDKQIVIFPLRSKTHGVILNAFCLARLLDMSFSEIFKFRQLFVSSKISPWYLSFRLVGINKTLLGLSQFLFKKVHNLKLKLYNFFCK